MSLWRFAKVKGLDAQQSAQRRPLNAKGLFCELSLHTVHMAVHTLISNAG